MIPIKTDNKEKLSTPRGLLLASSFLSISNLQTHPR
jgi:hypothetical protein